ncbi:thioredoxin family protein [bacterium]|nr:thioredoxin family protein [bacterium]
MKNKTIISLVLILPVVIYFILIAFNKDTAIEQSVNAQNNLPQIIVFSTPMCGECRKMAPIVDEIKKNYSDKISILKINAVDNKKETNKLVQKYNIYLVPTIVYLNKDGKIINRTEGSMPYDEFEKYIKDLLVK